MTRNLKLQGVVYPTMASLAYESLKAQWLVYVPPRLTVKTLHFVQTFYLRVPYESCSKRSMFSYVYQLFFLKEAN